MCLTPASTSLSPTCHSQVLGPQSHYTAALARHAVKCTSALNPNHKGGVLCVQGQENLPSTLATSPIQGKSEFLPLESWTTTGIKEKKDAGAGPHRPSPGGLRRAN